MPKDNNFKDVVDNYTEVLYKRASYLLNHNEDVEDIVQEVFLAALQNFNNYQGKSNIKTWLMAILKNKVADYYRKKYKTIKEINLDHYFDADGTWKKEQKTDPWQDASEDLLDNKEFKDIFENCLDRLPSKWNLPFKMYYLEEKKTEIICQEFNISTTNMWKVLQRGRLHLKECLDRNWFKK